MDEEVLLKLAKMEMLLLRRNKFRKLFQPRFSTGIWLLFVAKGLNSFSMHCFWIETFAGIEAEAPESLALEINVLEG